MPLESGRGRGKQQMVAEVFEMETENVENSAALQKAVISVSIT